MTTTTSASGSQYLKFSGHRALATRLVLSTLTGRPIHVSGIRASSSTAPGLAPHEITLLRLLESITNGTVIQISYTGTSLTYRPGLIVGSAGASASGASAALAVGSASEVLECRVPAACTRGVSYFITALCMLAPFAKGPVNIRFAGPGVITAATNACASTDETAHDDHDDEDHDGENDVHTSANRPRRVRPGAGDVSVDTVRTAVLPLLAHFGIPTLRLELRVLRRAAASLGARAAGDGAGGIVELRFAGQVRLPRTLHLHRAAGRVRRVRGVACATGTSASNNGRMIYAARGVLNRFVADVQIAAQYDVAPPLEAPAAGAPAQKKVGRKPGIGFGLSLVAESASDGVLYSADVTAPVEGGVTPEEVGKQCALQLLEVVSQGGNASAVTAGMMLTLMAMGSEDVGRLRLGREVLASEQVIELARDARKFGGSAWAIRAADDETDDLIVSVKGMGLGNIGRKVA